MRKFPREQSQKKKEKAHPQKKEKNGINLYTQH